MNESVILKHVNYGHNHHSNLHLPNHFSLTSQLNTKSLGVAKCQINSNGHVALSNGHSLSSKLNYHNSSHFNGSSSKNTSTNGSTDMVFLDSEGDENMISPSPEDNIDESNSCIEIIDHDDDDDDDEDDSVIARNSSARVSTHHQRSAVGLNARADCFLTQASTSVQNSTTVDCQLLTSTPSKSSSANGSDGSVTLALNSSVDSSLLDLAAGGLFDSSIVSRVNLTAAFHDHMPCTKVYRKVLPDTSSLSNSSSVLGNVSDTLMSIMSPLKTNHQTPHHHNHHHRNSGGNPDHLDYVYTSLQGPSTNNCVCTSSNEETEQIKFLQDIILSHFDLIAYQQEQIQKKDRQLLSLKQERETFVSRNDKLEKKVKFLSKKLLSLAQTASKQQLTTVTCNVSSNDYTDSTSSSSKCTIENGSNSNEGEVENCSDASNVKTKKNKTNGKIDGQTGKKKRSISTSLTPEVNGGSPSKKKQRSLSTSTSCKSQASSLSDTLDTSCDSSTSLPSAIGGSSSSSTTPLPPAPALVKRKLPIMKDFLTTDETYDVVQMRDPTYEAACIARRSKLSIQAGVVVRSTNLNGSKMYGKTTNGKLSNDSCDKVTNCINDKNSVKFKCNNNNNNNNDIYSRIEVPTWRVINFVPCNSPLDCETLDDDTFLKRHNKLELDERRRKRWDIQRLREQKHNEKLKQGRYYSNCAFINPEKNAPLTESKNVVDNDFVSFYPDPLEAEVIEVCDKLPITAFGHPIPRVPEKDFCLPWKCK